MIRVMIVDDEPYIRMGLSILIPWEKYGYKVCAEAANGMEALDALSKQDFDLIITDIKMPKMSGIEFIEHVREHINDNIHFIILSGFYEFEYAKKAIKYGVEDYILKPVQKDDLIRVLDDYKKKHTHNINELKNKKLAERIIFDNHMGHLLSGLQSDESLKYIKKYLVDDTEVRYIHILYDQSDERYLTLSYEEKLLNQNHLYKVLTDILGEKSYRAYKESLRNENDFAIGFIFSKKLADLEKISEKEYINKLSAKIKENVKYSVLLYIGQLEKDISRISNSYKSSKMIYNFYNISNNKGMVYYDDISGSISTDKYPVDKDGLDKLIRLIEENDIEMIKKQLISVYSYFRTWIMKPEIIRINLNYLMFNLIDLTRELDANIDREEVNRIISKWGVGWVRVISSIKSFEEFALEFAAYLSRLRKNTSGGVLRKIEREILENYMDNLTLKTLSKKYFINTAYLGQIFKKQFGMSFNDYLNDYRIKRATELLKRTDDKIYLIANLVGFKNTDYFISKFVQHKGITPLQFRKQFIHKEK